MRQHSSTARWRFRLAAVLAVLGLALLGACGGRPAVSLPASAPGPAVVQPPVGMPAFPATDTLPAPQAPAQLRLASATEFTQHGAAFSQQAPGTPSYAPDASGRYVFSPELGSAEPGSGAQHRAWGLYRFDGLDTERPVELDTDVAAAGAVAGGPTVALQYFVAVANYTTASWDWFGPFKLDAKLTLNAAAAGSQPAVTERYINATGTLYCCVLVDSSGIVPAGQNTLGRAAVALSSVTVNGSGLALPTKPLFLPPQAWKTGSEARRPDDVKRASSLQPSQFPVVSWSLVLESVPQFFLSQAQTVRVYRQRAGDSVPLLVGEVSATGNKFTDPLNCASGVDSAAGGTTYRYFVQAVNQAGAARPAPTDWFTVPILAPQGLQATQDLPAGAGTQVSWQACDGAVRYRIGRSLSADGSSAVEIGSVDAPALSYLDTTAPPGQYYWYFLRAEGAGDGNAANGLETGALSPLSSPAQGLRGYALTLRCTTAGVSGDGSAGSPYQLSSGQTYQFAVTDQTGADVTSFCNFSVTPPAAASFAAPPGSLGSIQAGGGAFSAAASFSYQGFTWDASAACLAN